MAQREENLATPFQATTRFLILIGFIGLVVGGVLFLVYDAWNTPVLATVISSAVVTVLCLALNGAWVAGYALQKKHLFSLNMLVAGTLVGAIVVGVNYYSYRHHRRYDATAASRYSLSSQTRNLLADLPAKVTAHTFFTQRAALYQDFPFVELARDMLEEYQSRSNNFVIDNVDAMRDVSKARQLIKDLKLESLEHNSVIFTVGEGKDVRTKVVTSSDMVYTAYSPNGQGPNDKPQRKFKGEEAFTSAILNVIDKEPAKVYFLTGHGERRINDYDERGYSALKDELKKSNLEVEALDLHQKGKVPDDCNVLVIAGPVMGIPTSDLAAIREYLNRFKRTGGKGKVPALLALLEPVMPGRSRTSGLGPLLKDFGIKTYENAWSIDASQVMVFGDKGLESRKRFGFRLAIEKYPKHEITDQLQGHASQLVTATCVQPSADASGDFKATTILQGSKQGWGETNLRRLMSEQKAEFDEGEDLPAPVSFGVAAEAADGKGARLVVFGDADLASKQALQIRGNLGLTLNSVLWLARKSSRLGLPPVDPENAKLQITKKREKVIEFFSVYGLPAAWVFFALVIWVLRTVSGKTTGRLDLALRFGILLGLLLAIAGGIFYSKGFETSTASLTALAGLVLIVAGIARNADWLKDVLRNRQTWYGANLVTMAVLAFLVVVIVNFLSTRSYLRWDRTEKKLYALSDTAINELKNIDRPVKATMLLPPGMNPIIEHINSILDEFDRYSQRIGVERIVATRENMDKIDLLEEELNTKLVRQDFPSTIFASRGNVKQVTAKDVLKFDEAMNPMMQFRQQRPPPKLIGEQAFLDAVLAVTNDEKVTLYFADGNGERKSDSFEDQDLGEFAKLLKRANFAAKTINLEEADTIPSDCNVLVLAAPTRPYSEKAKSIIREHLNSEGSLLVLAEPTVITGTNSGLSDILAEYNIGLNEGSVVIDVQPQLAGFDRRMQPIVVKRPSTAVQTSQYGYQTVTQDMEGAATQFNIACEVKAEQDPHAPPPNPYGPPQGPQSKWRNVAIVETGSSDGWVDRNVTKDSPTVEFNEGLESKGKASIAVAVEPNNAPPRPQQPFGAPPPPPQEKRKGPNIVAFGDCDFASNAMIRQVPGNEKLLMNTVRWLGKVEPRKFDITPKELDLRKIEKPPTQTFLSGTLYFSIFGIPALFLFPGVLVWILRRR